MYILIPFGENLRKIVVYHEKLKLEDDVETVFEKTVTRFGNGAKLDCPKEFLGKRAYIIIRKDQ